MNEVSSNTTMRMLQAEIDLVSVDHLALSQYNFCVSMGFMFFSKEIEQYSILFMDSLLSSQENPAFPL